MLPVLSWFGVMVIVATVGLIGMVMLAALKRLYESPRRTAAGRLTRRVTQPSCGSCQYPVTGLTTFTCPECGSDLREVGIRTPGSSSGGGWRLAALVVWTLMVLLIGSYISVVIRSALGPNRLIVKVDSALTPASNQYEVEAALRARSIIWPWQQDEVMTDYPSSATVIFTAIGNGGQHAILEMYPASRRFKIRFPGGDVQRSDGWPVVEDVKRWIGSVGAATDSEMVGRECDEIQQLIDSYKSGIPLDVGPYGTRTRVPLGGNWYSSGGGGGAALGWQNLASFSAGAQSFSTSMTSVEWFSLLLLSIWIVIWALGVRFIWRRW